MQSLGNSEISSGSIAASLTTRAAARALREIERRHRLFGEALRRSVEEVEDAEFEVIDATATTGKKAA